MLRSFKKNSRQKIGLTLSGGGMRGIAHIGILKALDNFGIRPDIISGSSMGSIVGAFYAYGYTPDEILDIAQRGHYFTRKNLSLSSTSIFKSQMLMEMFQKHLPRDSFENLKIPLHVCATELTNGIAEFFHTGKLHQALLASASIPYVFPPVRIGKKLYTDGGVMNNLPIEAIQDQCDYLIGAHVNATYHDEMKPVNAKKLFSRIVQLAIGTPVYQKQSQCHLFIDPKEMTQYGIFNSEGIATIFNVGYEYTMTFLAEKGFQKL